MNDPLTKARAALRKYLDRGHQALTALAADGPDACLEVLRKRDEAFHNFRALEALLMSRGVDIARDEEARAVWDGIRANNDELSRALAEELARLETQRGKVRAGRAKTQAYHSGVTDVRFVKRT